MDRLIEVSKAGKKYSYTYDPFNRRLSKVTPSEKVYYYWDDKNEIGSTKGELRILGEGFGAEIGAAVFIKLGKSIYTPIHDHRGALLTLLEKNGKQENYRYTAYGEELTKSSLSPWRFASKRVDEETGYVYFGRRYYSPDLGRWITTDPNGFQDGPNLYSYVHNSPLTGIDFYGEYAYWHQTKAWTKNAIDFSFPCASELFKLPADASLLKRGMLAGGAVLEIASLAIPATRAVMPMLERGAFQLGKAAFSKMGQKSLLQQANKTSTLAIERRIINDVGVTSGTRTFTQNNFRKNLIQRTGVNPGKSAQAHHVFPQKFGTIFENKSISINDSKFGSWWDTTSHMRNARAYNSKWEAFFEYDRSNLEIMNFGREIMKEYKIPTGF